MTPKAGHTFTAGCVTEGSRGLDILVGAAVNLRVDGCPQSFRSSFELCGMEQMLRMAESPQNILREALPRYTTSIDAARSIDPTALCVFASDIGADGLPIVKIVTDTSTTPIIEHTGIAATLQLAWCAAILRARQTEGR